MNCQGCSRKSYVNFNGSWFLTLKFPKGVTQFCRSSSGCSGNLDPYFAEIFPKTKWNADILYIFLFIFQWIGNLKIVLIKYNLKCKKNITEKFIISKKTYLLKLSNKLRSLECWLYIQTDVSQYIVATTKRLTV